MKAINPHNKEKCANNYKYLILHDISRDLAMLVASLYCTYVGVPWIQVNNLPSGRPRRAPTHLAYPDKRGEGSEQEKISCR